MKLSLEQREKNLEILNSLYKTCWKDESFKQQLIENPRSTLESFTGGTLNDESNGKSVEVSDQTDPDIIYFNIPTKVNLEDFELSEEELEMVSGGFICLGMCVAAIIGGSIGLYLAFK